MPALQSRELLDALKVTAAALREAKIPFALAGSLAALGAGGPATEHDVDLVIREADAEPCWHCSAARACAPRSHPRAGW